MLQPFRTLSSPSFERDVRKLIRRNPNLLLKVQEAAAILREDPYTTKSHNIKKLIGVRPKVSGALGLEIIEFVMMYSGAT